MLTELIIIFMGFMSRTKEADLKKVAIHNLGCKVNSYEAESMELMLKNAGYEIVPFDEAIIADVYIINTCSVTNIADRKSRQMLHKAKKMNPSAVVIAAGCYVQADEAGVKKDEAVDIVAYINHIFVCCIILKILLKHINNINLHIVAKHDIYSFIFLLMAGIQVKRPC